MFLAPMMLVFVGAGVVPLVLHWLSRSRQVEVRWGAMMFLEDVSPRRSRMNRLREWLVLLLRCLAIVLMAVAMARPVVGGVGGGAEGLADGGMPRGWLPGWIRGWGAAWPAEGVQTAAIRSAVLLVVDTSGSTSAPAGPTSTRMDEIREAASRVLSLLDESQWAGVVTAGGEGGALGEVFGMTADRAAVAARLATLGSGTGLLDVGGTLTRAMEVLGRVPAASRTLVLITDRQGQSFRGLDDAAVARLVALRQRAAIGRLVVLAVGGSDRDNVSVREIEVVDAPVLRGQPARVRVGLRNDGPTPRPGTRVRVQVLGADGRPAGTAEGVLGTADLAPDSDGIAEVILTFPNVGKAVLTASLEPIGGGGGSGRGGGGTGLGASFDDQLWRVVEVTEGTRVLVVGTLPGPVELALAPSAGARAFGLSMSGGGATGSGGGGDRLVVTRSGGAVPVFDLERYAAVVVPHLSDLTVDEVRALTHYVYGGGGLVVGLGPLTSRQTLAGLATMLPVRVGPASEAGGLPQRAEGSGSAATSAWTAHVGGGPGRDGRVEVLPGGVVKRWMTLEPVSGEAETVLRLSGGMPLAVLGRFGAGRVLVVGTPLEGPWNDLYRSAGYVPVIQAAVGSVVSSSPEGAMFVPGDVLRVRLGGPGGVVGDVGPVVMEGPTAAGGVGVLGVARIERGADGVRAEFGPVWRAGVYRMRFAPSGPSDAGRVEPVVVRFPAAESDLRAEDALQTRVVERLGGSLYRSASELTAADLRPGREVWVYVLLAAAMCLGGEILLTRRWAL